MSPSSYGNELLDWPIPNYAVNREVVTPGTKDSFENTLPRLGGAPRRASVSDGYSTWRKANTTVGLQSSTPTEAIQSGVGRVTGDKYAASWVVEAFRKVGIECVQAEKTRSGLYLELLGPLNSGQVDLLDHPRLVAQLCTLERRTSRAGRDSINHAPNAHDDVANAAAGALYLAFARPPLDIW